MNKIGARSSKGSEFPLFLVGKDSHGNWVAQDQSGRRGGLFVGRAEALKFARSANGNRPQAVILVPDILELDMSVRPSAGRAAADLRARPRRVA